MMSSSRAAVRCGCALLAVASTCGASSAVFAQQTPDYEPGVWHYHTISCVDTTVLSVTPRLGSPGQTAFSTSDFVQSGVIVTFNTRLGVYAPAEPGARAAVTHYQDTAGNNVMMREHRGDKVQVCFLGGPAPTTTCNPDTDGRGRLYRVYDYRERAQYAGQNEEHDCGGA